MKKTLPFLLLLFSFYCYAQEENAEYFLNQGTKQISQNHYQEAIDAFQQSVDLATDAGDKKALAKAYAGLGGAYHKAEQTKASVKSYLLALSNFKAINDGNGIATTSKSLGEVYADEKDYGLSVQYYTYGIKEAKKLNNELLEAETLVAIGSVYELQQKPEPALDAYSRALAIYRARGKNSEAGHTLSKMGNAYRKKTDYVQSILNYKEALGYFAGLDDRRNVTATLSSLGKVHALNDDYSESLRLYEQAYLDATSMKYNEVVIESCLGMAIAYEKLKQYPESIRYHKLYEQKKDSFTNVNHAKQMAALQLKYEKQRKFSQPGDDEEETVSAGGDSISREEYEATKRIRIIIIAVCSVLVLLVIGWFWRRKQQLKTKLREERMYNEAERQERLRLVQDIHSDIDSKLSKINYLSEAIVEKTNGMPTVRSNGEAMQDTTKMIEENIRDLVWLLTPKSTTLSSYITSTQEYVTNYFKDSPVEVLFSMPDKPSTNTIVKESQRELTAAIKESLEGIGEDPQASKVFFGMSFTGTRLMVSIKDNGTGGDRNDSRKKTMESHVTGIGGIMKIDAEPGWGTMVKMIIPINKQFKKIKKI
ncbi:tetratricopeptide repeat protein [Flavobacterium alkalisoli]|uniref:Tetratricopeptide repeat protein n=1 Tax=Flavobacterium alkalisoli TaxID=2602769 RepID=A0A5B9FVK1_9FLAO|nr:tetratricopeptide repeat protein [Flavobacterium alkalisoli]QEE50191.1 tetratricopeptide repeat protein [Flavobacterium alkalisoli]